MYKLYCDYCGEEIENSQINLEIRNVEIVDGKGPEFKIRHYHPDCFNYLYSTDYRKVGGRKIQSI